MEKRELFLQKIELEYKLFRRKMLMKGKNYILDHARKAVCMKDLYEASRNLSERWNEDTLQVLLVFPEYLEFLYRQWLREETSYPIELDRCIRKETTRLVQAYWGNEGEAA